MDINELFDFSPREVDGGYDVTVRPRNGMKVVVCSNGYDEMTMKLRDVVFPRIGSRTMVGGNVEKVRDVVIDDGGNIFVVNEAGLKIPWA